METYHKLTAHGCSLHTQRLPEVQEHVFFFFFFGLFLCNCHPIKFYIYRQGSVPSTMTTQQRYCFSSAKEIVHTKHRKCYAWVFQQKRTPTEGMQMCLTRMAFCLGTPLLQWHPPLTMLFLSTTTWISTPTDHSTSKLASWTPSKPNRFLNVLNWPPPNTARSLPELNLTHIHILMFLYIQSF